MSGRRGPVQPLTPEQDLALQRMAGAGAREASDALSRLFGLPVTLTGCRIRSIPIDRIADLLGGADAPVVAVRMDLEGPLEGALLVALDPDSAARLLARLLPEGPGPPAGVSMEESALLEAGNILAGAWLGALGRLLGRPVTMSVPELARDMAGAVLDGALAETSQGAGAALLVQTEIAAPATSSRGTLFLLPDPERLPAVLEALREGGDPARG